MAAGLTIARDNLELFIEDLISFADEIISDDLLIPKIYIDAEVDIEQIDTNLLKFLDRMRPFGPGNMRPKFCLRNVMPTYPRIVGENHLKFRARKNNRSLDCIAWNLGDQMVLVNNPQKTVDIVFVPTMNEWNGTRSMQLIVKAIKPHVEKGD